MKHLIIASAVLALICATLSQAQPNKYVVLHDHYTVIVTSTDTIKTIEFQDFQEKIMGNIRVIDNYEQDVLDEILTEEYNNHNEPIERE
jgi:hypothetical protein